MENPLIFLTRIDLFSNWTPMINSLAYATFVALTTFYPK